MSERTAQDAAPSGTGPLTVDRYRPEDRATLYDVCLRTGDAGQDATALYRDSELLGHVFLGPYRALAPELARVLRLVHTGIHTEGPWLADHPAHLHVDLLPEAQGGGHGRSLLEWLFDELAAAGVPGLHLGVARANASAVGFYRHLGMRTLESRPNAYMLGITLR